MVYMLIDNERVGLLINSTDDRNVLLEKFKRKVMIVHI